MSLKATRWPVLVLLALACVTCESVPMTAPLGTAIFLQVSPPFVVANGGNAVVTALLTEPAGTLVPDGTVVMFFTTLGRIDASVKTRDGVARANFVADSRSGTAAVTAYSGGAAPAACAGDASSASGEGSACIGIDIGSALPARVVLVANPTAVTGARSVDIVANVFDLNGNPVQNVPVIFTASGPGTMASGGSPQHTDSNGQAFDTLRTRSVLSAGTVRVTANLPAGAATATVDVAVSP